MTSMISFIVLLLATYSYSAPIVPEFETSTAEFEATTVEYEVINATVVVELNSTDIPVTTSHVESNVKSNSPGLTSSEESQSEESKNSFSRSSRITEDSSSVVMIPKRGVDVLSFTDATETTDKRDIEESSSMSINDKRGLEESTDSTATDLNESSTVDVLSFTDATGTIEPRDIEDFSSTAMNDKRGLEESTDSTVTDLNESTTIEDSSSIVMIPKRGIDVLSFTDATETTDKRDIEESSSISINDKRGLEESTATDLNESSTIEDSSSIVMIPKRDIDVTDASETSEKRDIEESSSTELNDKRSVEDFLFTTIESSTEFNQRAIRPVQSVEENIESSTIVSSEYQRELSTDVQPSSSVDSFVKFTGLLQDQPSATVEYETTSQTEDDFTTQSPVTSETVTKILSIIPGKISETKITINRPTEVPVVIQQVDQKQLSQGGNQSIIEETKSDN